MYTTAIPQYENIHPTVSIGGVYQAHPLIEAIRRAKTDSTALIAAKEAEIREDTEKRLLCQKDETEALAKGRAAADEREETGREMARLAERKAAAEGEYDRWPRSSGTSIS